MDFTEEARQPDVGFAVFESGDVALLATGFSGELLLCEVEFLATFAEHVTFNIERAISTCFPKYS